ncbi:MAG: FtsQ-type POTRA domain-containing protein [Nitrospiraceae bacterium]|nr:FtsQ-type POTRA domain-containing protein [Nitrospiraceae bacterium]
MKSRKVKKNTVVGTGGLAGAAVRLRQAGLVALPLLAVLTISYAGYAFLHTAFPLRQVSFSGNRHLSDEDLRGFTGLGAHENLVTLSSGAVYRSLIASPWVLSASVRKEFPGTLHILISEAEPFALLDMGGRHFIVDDRGKLLEELKDSAIPFLPVIVGNPFDKKDVYAQAIDLVRAIKETGLISRKDRIEVIANRPQDMTVNLDGVVVKVGSGEYHDKLVRYMELEDEIRTRNIPVDYIDLRFANRVVVKPVSEVVRR